jgi:predicted ATPase/DNA-binding SARP family transcriptional activator
VEVRVLGPVELVSGDSVVHLAPAERTLLAALTARIGERVGTELLEAALWPGRPPPTARKTLQSHIARLRRELGATAIVERSGGYVLDPGQVEVDARRVSRVLDDARRAIAGGRAADVIAPLREAQGAFRGEPYADVSESAVPAGEVQRLLELHADVIEETIEAELEDGEHQRCIGELEAFVQLQPYRERAWGQLMRALYQAGRPADALAAYGRVRLLLATELGLEPGPGLRELERSILVHDPALARSAPTGDALGPSNLPVALNPIVGRGRDLTALEHLFEDSRLVTLVGPGGIGKTTLALALAARLGVGARYGPYFVDLAPLGDVALVPAAIVAALGIEVDPEADAMDCVRVALRERRVALVVDNCEHLLPGMSALVSGLLTSTGGVRVLATSREALGVAGERAWPLDPLEVPPVDSSPGEVRTSEAGTLLLSRLPLNVATRSLGDDDVAAVGVICRSLDGMPLALELAAARSRTLSLPDLADRLATSINELQGSGHSVVPRHRTMRAALDWGHDLLSPRAKRALRAMSVFAGGCDLPAFEAVCTDDADPALDVLDELVRTSFVVADLSRSPARYRMLEPVRQYAAELLDASGERDERERRHLRHYAAYGRALHGGEDEPEHNLLEAMRPDLGNLRVALDTATRSLDRTEAGLWLAADMYDVWTAGAHHAEGLSRIDGLLRTGGGSPDGRSRSARIAGIVAALIGHRETALALVEQALDEARRGGTRAQERRARQVLSDILGEDGSVEAARQILGPALPAGRDQSTDVDAFCLVGKARLDLVAGALDEAESVARLVANGPFVSRGWLGPAALSVLAEVMFERGELDAARAWHSEALSLCDRIGDLQSVAPAHLDLVQIECAAGRAEAADDHLRAAVESSPKTHRDEAPFLEAGAALALCGGSPAQALSLAAAGLGVAIETRNAWSECLLLRLLGDAQLETGDVVGALATFERLVDRADPIPYLCRAADGHEGAAAANVALDRTGAADRHLATSAAIRERNGSRPRQRPAVDALLAAVVANARTRRV